jgi:hypothetical protein
MDVLLRHSGRNMCEIRGKRAERRTRERGVEEL